MQEDKNIFITNNRKRVPHNIIPAYNAISSDILFTCKLHKTE